MPFNAVGLPLEWCSKEYRERLAIKKESPAVSVSTSIHIRGGNSSTNANKGQKTLASTSTSENHKQTQNGQSQRGGPKL